MKNKSLIQQPVIKLSITLVVFLTFIITPMNVKGQQNTITFDIGAFAVTLLSEGQQQGNKGILIDATEEMLQQTIPDGTFPNAINAFLVETGNRRILFDTGLGKNLLQNLEKHGKTVEEIDIIFLTHMHGDHIGGLLQNDTKTFPSATLYIPRTEYDYWMSDEAMQRLPENRRGNFMSARKVIEIYKDKLQLFEPGEIDNGDELIPGIRSIAAYGHTPGHTGYMLESNGEKLLIWGDLTHAIAIQIPFPEVAVTYDVDPVKAVESRTKLLKYVFENKIRIAGMHVEFPGMGYVRKNQTGGYRFTLTCECEGR